MALPGGGPTVYAYEVDGLGGHLTDFDDPNWPSLVAMPLLGWGGYDAAIYSVTRARLHSSANEYWLEGKHVRGMGSPHTADGMAWALGTLSEALTAGSAEEGAEALRSLAKLQCGDGLMHESIHVDRPSECTRRWFEWANALAVVAVEALLGEDCDAAAEAQHRADVAQLDGGGLGKAEAGPGGLYRPGIEAWVAWDVRYQPKVEDWKGIGWKIL